MTSAHRLADRVHHGAAWAAAVPRAEEESTVGYSRLRDHLLRDHGRTAQEIDGLPLADLHRFEHVEQEMGLNDLGHRYLADGADPAKTFHDKR
ncbi:MAG TPA: hypothetical protein VM688_05525 [Nocardioidaceae bacterium]|nr:hypothetical protein [Nocardioidaceae bacterium]